MNIEFETLKSLCGEAVSNPARAVQLLDEIGTTADDFAEGPLRELWSAIEARLRTNVKLDAVSLIHALKGRVEPGVVAEVLTDTRLGVTDQRLRILRDVGQRRRYGRALQGILEKLHDPDHTLDAVVAESQRLLRDWNTGSRVATMETTTHEVYAELERTRELNEKPTVPTGIDALDAVIGGLQPTLTIVGALPGVGKSALLGAIARNIGASGKQVGLISCEDDKTWLTRRLIAEQTGIPTFVLANKVPTQRQLDRVHDSLGPVYNTLARVHCDDTPRPSPEQVISSARRMIANGCCAILVDHLGEIQTERGDRHDLEIADVLSQLRALTKQHRVAVVVAVHLRRRDGLGVFDIPKLTDFAFSSAVERMARVALGLSLTKDEKPKIHCSVLKQTQGKAGLTIELEQSHNAGIVIHTPAPEAAKALYDRDLFDPEA